MPSELAASSPMPTYKKAALQTIAYKCIRDSVNSVLTRFDLNSTQWMILGALYEQAVGLRMTDIAHDLQVEVPLITTLVQPLARKGLVRSHRGKADRRTKPLALTMDGQKLVRQIETTLGLALKPLERNLLPSEIDGYFHTLQIFIGNADHALS